MKRFQCESNIGEGLFSDDPVAIELEFPDGSVGVFKVYALTPRRILKLRKSGVKFQDFKDDEEGVTNIEKIIGEIVHSGEWNGLTIDDSNKHAIVGNQGLTTGLINAARFLAEERQESTEKNSEN